MSVVLTRHRAVAQGLPCALSISVSSQLPATVIQNLADPVASLGAEPARLGPEPVVAEGGVLAAAALAKLASCLPAALVLRVGAADAPLLAQCRDLASIEAAAVFKYDAAAGGLERVAEARVPLADAENARMIAFRPRDGGGEHLAILIGAPDPAAPVLVRLHSECFTHDLLASLRSDRRDQLRGAIAAIARAGGGCCSTSPRMDAALVSSTSGRPTSCRTPVSTRSTPTSSWALTWTSASTSRRRKCCASSVSAWSAC